ncbi:hypothetical protein ACFU3E_03755 [Streptomyces sp. NPDC057424]|uniref:hypothetical protein n=1 Tax=Streptomyces sp. NPDC057424 TaxID=3346127 RepID=UPI0036BBEFB6
MRREEGRLAPQHGPVRSKLADRFRTRFRVADQHGPYPAMALGGSGRPVDSVTSNLGHLLATGILNADETATVAARLAAPDMPDAYGLRTMSSRSGGYGPPRHHCGTVRPHDTAVASSPAPDTPRPPPGSSRASSTRPRPSTTGCRNCGAAAPARRPGP